MIGKFFKWGSELGYDYKDYMSPKHFIVMGILLALIITLVIVLRKVNHKKIDLYLKILAIFMPITEAIKIHYCAVISRAYGLPYDFATDLPFYTCSIFMVALPLAAFFKKRYKDIGLSFLTTIGIVAGLSNFIVLNVLTSWPMFHYMTFNSIFFHGIMVFTGLWLLTSGYVKLEPINMHNTMILVFIFSAFAIPVTYECQFNGSWSDYMLYCHGNDLPLIGDLAAKARDAHCLSLFTIGIMTIGYSTAAALVYGISKLIQFLSNLNKKKESC